MALAQSFFFSLSQSLKLIIVTFENMKRKFVDTEIYESRNMEQDGNIDYKFWHNKTNDERVRAAGIMTSVAFRDPFFFKNKIERTIYSTRKHSS